MASKSEGISTIAVIAVVVGGILAWSGLRGWKISLVVQDFLTGVDPKNDPNLQKPENQLPVSVAGLASEAFGNLLSSVFGGNISGNPSPPYSPHNPFPLFPINEPTNGTTQDNFKYAQLLAGQFGWNSPAELNAWHQLGMNESGWNNTAQNKTSTAYGIGQFLDSTWKSYGPKTSDPYLQTLYMAQYIRDRYGSPSQALAAWNSRSPHWY